ncbi:sensor histidine kinase [Haloferax sp. DFSO60]|uniref:sensor histidine kinase n=1 Tax=Haloferax sp. DFSO60 TaxID=3388652 RepID=UPI00397B1008
MSTHDHRFPVTAASVGNSLVYGTGVAFILLHVAFVLSGRLGEQDLLFGWISPTLMVLLLVYVHRWRTANQIGDEALRLAGWMGTGIIVFGGSGVLVILYQQSLGGVFLRPAYSVLGWATGGTVIGLIVGMYDVERRVSMAETVEALTRTERLSRQLRVYNRVLRHDVRTAANISTGYANLILESPESAEQSVEIITQQMERMTRLTEQSRKIASLHRDSTDNPGPFDFTDEIEENAQKLECEFPAVDIRLSLPSEPLIITSPSLPIAFNQVLQNAVEHNTNSDPTIEVTVKTTDDFLTLEVEDNGPGTPDAEIEILDKGFETQLQHSDGIGLWLVRWIVDDLDGDLTFENGSDGNVVTLTVPLATV